MAVLKALAAELSCKVLINRHETRSEFTVLQETVQVFVQSIKYHVTVLLHRWNVQSPQSDVQLLRIHVTSAVLVENSKGIDQIEVLSQREIDFLRFQVLFKHNDFLQAAQEESFFSPGQDASR